MNLYDNAVSFTASFMFLVLVTIFLRYRGVITKTDSPLIAKLTVDVVLPSLLISKLVFIKISPQILLTCAHITLTEMIVGFASYVTGKYVLKLSRPSLGVFILCSTFGSTAILGTAFISAIYNGNDATIAYALMIGEISNGIPGYIFLYVISKRFGDNTYPTESIIKRLYSIALSPPVAAIIFSLIWSALDLPTQGIIITPLLNAANFVGLSLVLMIALLNGLAIAPISLRDNIWTIILCVLFVLFIEPIIVFQLDNFFDLSLQDRQISFIESAMPSANAVIAYAIRYKCDEKLAATLVTTTAIIGAFSLPILMLQYNIFTQ
jgi:predicted permease